MTGRERTSKEGGGNRGSRGGDGRTGGGREVGDGDGCEEESGSRKERDIG